MINYYKKYESNQKYLQEYFDDEEYERQDVIYKNIYIPFIKEYLPIFIKSFFAKDLSNIKSLDDIIIPRAFYVKKSLNVPRYEIKGNVFYVSARFYQYFEQLRERFLNYYNIKIVLVPLKKLIDAYYMELQRIDYESVEKEKVSNLYNLLDDNREVRKEILLDDIEEIYEEKFLKQFIPLIIEKKINKMNIGSNWDNMSSNLVLCISRKDKPINENDTNYPTMEIEDIYYDYVTQQIVSFLNFYNIGKIIYKDDNKYKIEFNNLKGLIDAYYMELQRLEYIKGESLKRKK